MKSYIVYEHIFNYDNGTKSTHCLYNGTIETRAQNTYKNAVENAKRLQEITRIDVELVVLDNVNYGGCVYTNGYERSRKAKRK